MGVKHGDALRVCLLEHRVWVVEGLFYMAEPFDNASKADLKGDHRANNKGLCDLLIFKHSLKRHLVQREAQPRADDLLLNTDVSFAQWLEHAVEPRVKSYKAWTHAEASGNLTWRAGRAPSEIRWLALVEETVFATL